ncbi:hypothetical protein [Eupransor demetentiae]|uniref:Uncharacterized protein n=1 Tax=Eupransor demetentiae TaxID=3109584 RepID=A0ABP0ES88_9LACO|nr:hypothetical protein R54876_GBNLAHCA_00535 [Lactobacillaceae bacterium LMG 33000]
MNYRIKQALVVSLVAVVALLLLSTYTHLHQVTLTFVVVQIAWVAYYFFDLWAHDRQKEEREVTSFQEFIFFIIVFSFSSLVINSLHLNGVGNTWLIAGTLLAEFISYFFYLRNRAKYDRIY